MGLHDDALSLKYDQRIRSLVMGVIVIVSCKISTGLSLTLVVIENRGQGQWVMVVGDRKQSLNLNNQHDHMILEFELT